MMKWAEFRISRGLRELGIIAAVLMLSAFPLYAETGEPDCVFVQGPDIRPSVAGPHGGLSECPCYLTGIVENTGSAPAYYVHVIVTVWDRETEELVHVAWTDLGMLKPGQEHFFRFFLGLEDIRRPDYEEKVLLEWKDKEYPPDRVDCRIDSTYTKTMGSASASIHGFVKNIDSKGGFASALRAHVLDRQGKTSNIIDARMPHIPLRPGQRAPFVLTIPGLSASDRINLSFEEV